jgi:hypothetical protein
MNIDANMPNICQTVKELYDNALAEYREFLIHYPKAVEKQPSLEVQTARIAAIASAQKAADFLDAIENNQELKGILKDVRMKIKINRILKADMEKMKADIAEDEPDEDDSDWFDETPWDVQFTVNRGILHISNPSRRFDFMTADQQWNSIEKLLRADDTPVEFLDLHREVLEPNHVRILAQALRHPRNKLKALRLSNNKLSNISANEIADSLESPNCKLQYLQMEGCGIQDVGFGNIVGALKSENTRLMELNLSGNDLITENALGPLYDAFKSEKCKLRTLELANIPDLFEIDNIDLFIDALNHPNCKVKKLNLSGSLDAVTIVDHISALKTVEILILSDTEFDAHCAARLVQAGFGKLKKLVPTKNKGLSSVQRMILDAVKRQKSSLEVVF